MNRSTDQILDEVTRDAKLQFYEEVYMNTYMKRLCIRYALMSV